MSFAILVPAFNAEATLSETLASITAQEPPALSQVKRIVIADDGSTDTTCQLARNFAQSSGLPMEVWEAECNRGERACVNQAFTRLKQEGIDWCFVLHADDVAKPNWLSALAPFIRQPAPRVVSLCCSWDDWFPPDRIHEGENDVMTEKRVIAGDVAAACGTLKSGCWWHFSGCAMNLREFFEVGPFHEGMPQLGDLEWLIRSELMGRDIWYVPRALIKYRQTQSNVSAVSFRTNRDLREKVMICDILSSNPSLTTQVKAFAWKESIAGMRRSLKSACTGKWQRCMTAAALAWKLWLRSRGPSKNA